MPVGRVAAVTLAQVCSLLLRLPFVVQAVLVLVLALLVVGVAAVSLAVGRAVAWVQDRCCAPTADDTPEPVDPFVRVLGLPPHAVAREFRAIVEASADDTEAAR